MKLEWLRWFGVCAALLFFAGTALAGITGMWLFDNQNDPGYDSSGMENHGELRGGVDWTADGKFVGALQFDGLSGWVEIENSAGLIPPEITVVAWIYLDNVTGNHAVAEKYDWQVNKGSFVLRTGPVLGAGAGDDVSFMFIVGQMDPPPLAKAPGILVANEWIHVAGTIDGQHVRLYVNGNEEDAVPVDSEMLPSDTSLSLGSRGDTKDIHWMAGMLDEVAIFDEALSANDIRKVMDSGLTGYLAVSPQSKAAVVWAALKRTSR